LKRLFSLALILGSLNLSAQFKPVLSAARPYSSDPGAVFLSYSNEWNDFMLFGRNEHSERIYSLVMTDDADEISLTSDIRVATQVEDNHFSLAGLALAGRNLTAFVESRNFKTGRNVMAMQAVDNKGGLTSEGMLVGYFDFKDEAHPGKWYIASSPDQKSIALIAQLPEPGKFLYYYLGENLTILRKGSFTISNTGNKVLKLKQFLTSDKGDLFLVAEGSASNKHYPLVYKSAAGSDECVPVPMDIAQVVGESGAYLAAVNPEGALVIAGYLQSKTAEKSAGTWIFDGYRLSSQSFASPVQALKVNNLAFGKDVVYLNGQSENSIHVAGFNAAGAGKFNLTIAREHSAGEMHHQHSMANAELPEHGIASGILRDQLCLVYNDPAGKYKHGADGMVPVAVSVSKTGVLSKPIVYTGLFESSEDNAMVLPRFFSANEDHIRVLANTENGIRVITFRAE